MGVRLNLSVPRGDHAWTDICDGAEFLMRPATTPEYRAAEAAASERLNQAIMGLETLAELGIPAPSAEEIGDASLMLGLSRELMAVELAMRIVKEWRGVFVRDEATAEDVTLPLTARAMAAFLSDPLRHNAFEAEAYRRIGAIAVEGKRSPLPQNGSQAVAAPIATAASKTGSPAPAAT